MYVLNLKKYPNLDFVPIIGDVRVIERLRMVLRLIILRLFFMPLPTSMFH